MKRAAFAAVILAFFAIGIGIVSAVSPHFINSSASLANNGDLTVTWKEAGLGNNALIHYVASADASATYACINGGGNHPKASNKETFNGPVITEGDFSSGKNGSINGSLTLTPPDSGDFTCPGGQQLKIAQATYTNVALTDATNGVSAPIASSFCKQFINLAEFACP